MLKFLIASALIAAQLVTWTSEALYMCVASDGSVCVDRGPASCNHCEGGAAGHQPRCCESDDSMACCHDHNDAASCDDALALAAESCDCRHALISQSQASIATRQAATDVERLTHAFIAALPMLASPTLTERIDECSRLGPPSEPPAHLRALGSIILRC